MEIAKKIIFKTLSILLGLILIVNIYNFISLKIFHKDIATINGYAILEVVSGSMEPTIHIGDMIIINTKDKDYRVTDVVTFKDKEGTLITHRIIYLDHNTVVTRGDHNNTEDPAASVDNIVGKYVTKINGAGKILAAFKNPLTMIMIFIIGLLACILLSTDHDGNPILDAEELEFQAYLKNKNEQENATKVNKKIKYPSKLKTSKDSLKWSTKSQASANSKKLSKVKNSQTKKATENNAKVKKAKNTATFQNKIVEASSKENQKNSKAIKGKTTIKTSSKSLNSQNKPVKKTTTKSNKTKKAIDIDKSIKKENELIKEEVKNKTTPKNSLMSDKKINSQNNKNYKKNKKYKKRKKYRK